MDDLLEHWCRTFPGAERTLGEDLLHRWNEPHRRYHTVEHLRAVLAVVDAEADEAHDPSAVRLAAWYHDAIYDPTRADNEVASAELARTTLNAAPNLVAEVDRLVRLTATHQVTEGDRNAALLCDADLSVLAGDPATYERYTVAVRAEYAHVPAALFRAGRAAVLQALLAKPHLFHLPRNRQSWERAARANVEAEIAELNAPAAEQPTTRQP